ncbi:MAG TPA: hypothetical protein VHW04_00100, partial [Solirubrobacteraceae bacterium]|nr:hypothetical protein [Solirubrobacteraceae bacterium]
MNVLTPHPLRSVVTSGVAVVMVALACLGAPGVSRGATSPVDVFPVPGGRVAAPGSQITFRGLPAGQVGPVSVTGSESGAHAGSLVADSDGQGASFVPSTPFTA